MVLIACKNFKDRIDPRLKIEISGNWGNGSNNHKAIAKIYLSDDGYAFTHQEILDIIKLHIDADLLNTKMIHDDRFDTGNVDKSEDSFIKKIQTMVNKAYGVTSIHFAKDEQITPTRSHQIKTGGISNGKTTTS